MELEPRIIFGSGIPSAGKTSTLKEVARRIINSFYLDRDEILLGINYIAQTKTHELLPFEQYVANDTVFPENARKIETPFGEMIQVDPLNAFNRRHGRDQTYIIQSRLARVSLELGKVPILESFFKRQINDGTLRKVIGQQIFDPYPRFHIHFIADLDICYQRSLERIKKGHDEAWKYTPIIKSRQTFFNYINKYQTPIPEGLKNHAHFLMDTSHKTTEQCAKECIDYISQNS